MCEFQESEKSDKDSKNEKPSEMSSTESPITDVTVTNDLKEPLTDNKSEKNNDTIKPTSFEDALTMTKFGKFNYAIILISGTILTSVLMETLGMSFILPVSQCDMKLTTQDKGILSAIGFAGIITSSHLWGFLADTKGRRAVILPTLAIAFMCTLFSSVTQTFWLFVVLRFFNGFFISGSSATVYAYLGEYHNVKNRSRAIMGASVIFGITCILLPGIAWLVINQEWQFYIPIIDLTFKPWRLFLIVCGLPSLICSLALIRIPESPKFMLAQGKEIETIAILQKMNRINNGRTVKSLDINRLVEEQDQVAGNQQLNDEKDRKGPINLLKCMWKQTVPLFMPMYIRRTLLACTIQFGVFATSNGMYMWFPEILNRMADFMITNPGQSATICDIVYATRLNVTAKNIDNFNVDDMECITKLEIATYEHSMVLEVLYAFGFAFIGLIINAVGKLPILFGILVGCGLCGVIAVYVQIQILAIYLYLILLLCGLGVTVVNAATVDLFPTNLRAMAVAISLMMGRLGSVVGANVVGLLLDHHCQWAFLSSGISLIVCGFLAFFIPNIRKISKNLTMSPSNQQRLSICSVNSTIIMENRADSKI